MNPIIAAIILALVNILIDYLKQLLEQWLSAQPATAFAPDKQAFLTKVSVRFWLGPKRVERAGKLWDKAVARYSNSAFRIPASTAELTEDDRKRIVSIMTDGLTLDPSEL